MKKQSVQENNQKVQKPVKKISKWRKYLGYLFFILAGIVFICSLILMIALPFREKWAQNYLTLANSALEQKDYEGSLAQIEKAKILAPDLAKIYFTEGEVYENLKNYDKALEKFQYANSINPNDKETLFHIGRILWEEKHSATAIKYLRAVEEENFEPNPNLLLGKMYFEEKDFEVSAKYFEKIDGENFEAVYYLGLIGWMNSYELGKEQISKLSNLSYEKNDLNAQILSLDAEIKESCYPYCFWIKMADLGFADVVLDSALAYSKTHDERDALFSLGYIYKVKNNLEDAKTAFLSALEIDPIYSEAYFMLSQVYQELGEEIKSAESKAKAELYK